MDNLIFEPMNFVTSLKYMGVGLLGIFVVIGLIVGATCLLNYITSTKTKKKN